MIRRLFAEALGSLLLAATVIGSGIMAERLAEETPRLRCSRTPEQLSRCWWS